LGYLTAFAQNATIVKLKDNADIPALEFTIDILIFAFGLIYIIFMGRDPGRSIVTIKCQYYVDIPDSTQIDYVYDLIRND